MVMATYSSDGSGEAMGLSADNPSNKREQIAAEPEISSSKKVGQTTGNRVRDTLS